MFEPNELRRLNITPNGDSENEYSIAYNKLIDYITETLNPIEYDVALQLVHSAFQKHAKAVRAHEEYEALKDKAAQSAKQSKQFDYWQNEALAKMSKLDTLIERLRALNDMEAEYCATHSQRNHIMSARRTPLEGLERQASSVRFEFAHPQADDIPF
jgi:hypothetical protein